MSVSREKTMVTASELCSGDVFSFSDRKNAKRMRVSLNEDAAPKIIGGPDWYGSVPDKLKGQLLIILDNCGQITVDENVIVYKY